MQDEAMRIEWLGDYSYRIDDKVFPSGFQAILYLQEQSFTGQEALLYIKLLRDGAS